MVRVSKKVDEVMADTDNPESLPAPSTAPFGEGVDCSGARRERGLSSSRTGPVGRLLQFIRDVRAELKRVSWPTPKEVKNTTIITLIAVIFFAAYLFLVDQTLARLIGCDGSIACGGHPTGLYWLMSKLFG